MLENRILTKDAFKKKDVTVAGWVEEFSERYIIAPSFVKIPHFQIADMINKRRM